MSIKTYINERVAQLLPQLNKAREAYSKTGDNGWACRINELDGRLSELEILLRKIERDEQR